MKASIWRMGVRSANSVHCAKLLTALSDLPSPLAGYRAEILRLAALHGARNVRVFGSFARGESREGSDLDLLVTLGEGRSLLDLVGLKQDLEDLVHRSVDVVSERGLSPYARARMLSEAIPL